MESSINIAQIYVLVSSTFSNDSTFDLHGSAPNLENVIFEFTRSKLRSRWKSLGFKPSTKKAVGFPGGKFAVQFMFLRRNFVRKSCRAFCLSFEGLTAPRRTNYYSTSMSEAPQMPEDCLNIIQPHKHFIVLLPSENFKVLDLKPNSYHTSLSPYSYDKVDKSRKIRLLFDE
jgi:hypothetical protein